MENRFITCEYCPFFRSAGYMGNGVCDLRAVEVYDSMSCFYLNEKKVNRYTALTVLSYFQKWRRGGNGLQPSGYLLGLALDEAIRSLRDDNREGIR